MTTLTKTIEEIYYAPASPGDPGSPGSPYIPAYCAEVTGTVCGMVWYAGDDGSGLVIPDMGGGYGGHPSGGFFQWECWEESSVVCYPEQPEVPSIPPTPPTPEIRIRNLNIGWNSHSRSIEDIETENYIVLTFGTGTTGALVVLGKDHRDSEMPSQFSHGIAVDVSGIKVYENGVLKQTLEAVQSSLSEVRIYRRDWFEIIYHVIQADGDDVIVRSAAPITWKYGRLYAYSWLYTGGDKVLTMDIVSGEIVDGASRMDGTSSMSGYAGQTVTMEGTGSLVTWGISMLGAGTLSVPNMPGASRMEGTSDGYFYAKPICSGNASIGALDGKGGEKIPGYGASLSYMEPLYSSAYGGMFVPADPVTGYVIMNALVSAAHMVTTHMMTGAADIGAVVSLGGDFLYGEARDQQIQPLTNIATDAASPYLLMIEPIIVYDDIYGIGALLIEFTSSGAISSVLTGTVEMLQEIISGGTASGAFTVTGDFNVTSLSTASALTRGRALVGTRSGAEEGETGLRVWCVNLNVDSDGQPVGASGQYEQFGFIRFFKRDGYTYGIADDGIYKLTGTTNDGGDISTIIDFGKSNYGIPHQKMIENLYVGIASSGKLLLKVVVDGGTEYTYEMRSSSADMKNHRIDLGRGLIGNYWHPVLVNQNGDDFDMEGIEFDIIPMTRKI